VCEREKECVYVRMSERERMCVFVCECVCEIEREGRVRERGCVRGRKSVYT